MRKKNLKKIFYTHYMPETNIVVVDFLDLDTSKITFQKPKPNKHNGTQIGIRYNGETLYVKYEGVTPFGIQENYDSEENFMESLFR